MLAPLVGQGKGGQEGQEKLGGSRGRSRQEDATQDEEEEEAPRQYSWDVARQTLDLSQFLIDRWKPARCSWSPPSGWWTGRQAASRALSVASSSRYVHWPHEGKVTMS